MHAIWKVRKLKTFCIKPFQYHTLSNGLTLAQILYECITGVFKILAHEKEWKEIFIISLNLLNDANINKA